MQRLPSAVLIINGLVYCYLAWLFIHEPMMWFARLGIELQEALGYTELKTMYIGMMGSMGVFSLLAAARRHLQYAAVLMFLLSYTALALVRSWGIFIEGQYEDFTVQLLLTEIVSVVVFGLTLQVSSKQL